LDLIRYKKKFPELRYKTILLPNIKLLLNTVN
jgi:hypothetical protein